MNSSKPWYMSKTILTSIVGAIVALGLAFGILPEGYDEEPLIGGILAITSLLAIVFRKNATTEIRPTV